jgi:hypothetical protein
MAQRSAKDMLRSLPRFAEGGEAGESLEETQKRLDAQRELFKSLEQQKSQFDAYQTAKEINRIEQERYAELQADIEKNPYKNVDRSRYLIQKGIRAPTMVTMGDKVYTVGPPSGMISSTSGGVLPEEYRIVDKDGKQRQEDIVLQRRRVAGPAPSAFALEKPEFDAGGYQKALTDLEVLQKQYADMLYRPTPKPASPPPPPPPAPTLVQEPVLPPQNLPPVVASVEPAARVDRGPRSIRAAQAAANLTPGVGVDLGFGYFDRLGNYIPAAKIVPIEEDMTNIPVADTVRPVESGIRGGLSPIAQMSIPAADISSVYSLRPMDPMGDLSLPENRNLMPGVGVDTSQGYYDRLGNFIAAPNLQPIGIGTTPVFSYREGGEVDAFIQRANGGSASSSGVRRLKMSGYQEGGEVTDEMFVGTRPEDFPETSDVDKKAGELLRALSEGTRGFVGAEPIEAGSEAYRTGQALANMPAVGVVAATAKGAGKAKDALKALTKKDIKLIASELETSRGQLAELAKKYPQLRDASVADIKALTKGEPFTAFRGISLLPGRELRKESTPSMTVDPSVALGMLKDAPVMITKEGFITATPVLRQYPGMKASETQVYVPSLIEQITERQPGALEMKIPTRSGEKMTVADVFKEVKGEKELLADVSKKEPRDILFDRYQGGVGDRYLMEVARRVLAGKWDGGEALLKEIGGYQTDPKGLVQEFDSFAELVKESALKKAKGGDVSNDEFIQEMITGTRPTDLPVKRQEEGVSNNNSTQEMFVGTRPSDFSETSPVDTAVSDFISSRSKLVTDPQEFFRVMGQNIEEYHGKPLREDPQKYLTEQLGPGALAGTVGKTAKQLFSSLPSSEAPFVSRLDEFVSSLPGAVQKDQFLNQLKGKFRDYDIGRAQEALADLPGNAKLTPFELLNRVKRVYDPTTFTTKIDLPKAEGDYYAGMDNPFKTKEGFSQKPLGVIHLLQGVNPATSPDAGKLMAAYDDIVNRLPDTSFNIFDKTDRNPVSLAQDIYKIANRAGLSSVKDLGMDVQTVLQNMAQSGSDWNTLVSSKHRLGHPGSYKPEEIKEALSETARITGTLPEENVKSLQKIAEEINARRTAKEDYSDLESQYHKSFPYAFAEDLEKANRRLWNEHREGKRQIGSLLEGLQKREGINTRAYKGQHSSLAEDPSTIRDPIAFSRFTEHTTDIPGLGKVDGIYVNELQSDRLDDIRKKGRIGGGPQEDLSKLDRLDKQIGEAARQFADYKTAMGFRFMNETDKAKISDFNSKLEGLNTKRNTLLDRIREGEYSLKESFAGMEESPQVIQQLMAKNAVAGAMQLGKRFVAFPGAESAQAQLYEKLPNNLKQVVKDLGPGFELRPITLPKPDTSAGGEGGELTSYAIVWGDEAADRIKKQGVPFKDGGEVSTKDFIKRLSKGGDVSNDEFIQEMMTGTRPTDETTSPGILPPEIRQAVDVPLDFANLLIRGTAAVPIGGVAGLYKGITGGKYGTQEGVKEADTEAARMMAKITGEPKTQTAKDVLQSIGDTMQKYKLDAALPQLLTLPSPGPGAASALMRSYELAETPPLGTVKLAGDKGVKPATPPTDQMGFYSPAEKAVMGLPQDKGTASQMLAQITKTQGVKPVELRATGLEDYLKGKGNEPVTKQEIQDFLTNNRVQVDEVVLGKGQTLSPEAKKLSGEALSRMEEVDEKLASYFEGVEEVAGQDPYSAFIMLRSSIGRRAAKGDQEALDELNAFNLPPEIKDLVLEFGRNKNEYIKYTSQARKMEKPKFDRYNTPGGQNAREIYLTLPLKKSTEAEARSVVGNETWSRMTPRATSRIYVVSDRSRKTKSIYRSQRPLSKPRSRRQPTCPYLP